MIKLTGWALALALVIFAGNIQATSDLPTPPKELIQAATKVSKHGGFPTSKDLVAIAWVESSFNPRARNGISRGIMQVNKGPLDVSGSVKAASELLREYHATTGSVRGAVEAYNVGITKYRRGVRVPRYYEKYLLARSKFHNNKEKQR